MAQRFFVGDLEVSVGAFDDHDRIPDKHTSNGEDVSPPIKWSGEPPETKQFAIVVHDPDAPLVHGYTHWVAYNIPASVHSLAEAERSHTDGTNNAGNTRYNGPAPPPGHGTHHYYFWVYALDTQLDLPSGLTREQLFDAIADHVLEQARYLGTYSNS